MTLLLAGCRAGEGDAQAADGASIATEQGSSVDDEADPEPEGPLDPEPDAAGGVSANGDDDPAPAPADGADGSGDVASDELEEDEPAPASRTTGEHRPPPAAQALADCATVTDPPPGAKIVFPADDDPSWLQAGPGPVIVEFIGCSDTFEANLQYEAFHEQDTTPTLSGITQGGTLGTWEAFGFEDTYGTTGDWTVVVFVSDAATGARVEYDEVTFTVD